MKDYLVIAAIVKTKFCKQPSNVQMPLVKQTNENQKTSDLKSHRFTYQ